jgi:hypothetical protein
VKRWLTVGVIVLVLAGWYVFAAPALAATPDEAAVQKILAQYHSPLPWWTITAYARAHPDFDIGGYLTVAFCESDYCTIGKSATYHNPGNIIARPPYYESWRVWYTWQIGTFTSSGRLFGAYPDAYTGQRALIRLLYDHPNGYNALLREHKWYPFAVKFYGTGPGLDAYVADLVAAHARIVKQAARYGAMW